MEELAHSENLKFSAEICLRVRIPPPAPASPSRPVPLIEERGDFFFLHSIRRLDDFPPAPNHDIQLFASHTSPPIQLRYAALFPISPPPVPFSRAAASEDSMQSIVPLFYSVWRDAMPLPPRAPFPMGGEARSRPRSTLPYPSNRLLVFLLASLSAGRLGVFAYPLYYTVGGANACFSRAYPFSPSIPPRYVIY